MMAKIRFFRNIVWLLIFLVFVLACNRSAPTKGDNAAFVTEQQDGENLGLWERIQESGELIVITFSGPTTYYEYQGKEMGLQYAYAQHFARQQGLRLRVEVVRDTLEMAQRLRDGDADIACALLPQDVMRAEGLKQAGVCDSVSQMSWAVNAEAEDVASMLDSWYSAGVRSAFENEVRDQVQNRTRVKRRVYAPYLSRGKGVISAYDALFKQAAVTAGCDWRLIAAMCYQESCFDPQAESWAGAKGLMQLMPATAQSVGVAADKIFEPAENVTGAGRVLRGLFAAFSDIKSPAERVKFVLASYNGGAGHVRDAMALARRDGRDAGRWSDVGEYVLKLSDPRYYRDPLVKYGYMIGQETYSYVASVCDRYRAYGGAMAGMTPRGEDNSMPHRAAPKGKRSEHKIYTPDDPDFFKMQAE